MIDSDREPKSYVQLRVSQMLRIRGQPQELVVVLDVFVLIKQFRSQHHQHAVFRKLLLGRPDLRGEVESKIGPVEPDQIPRLSVVKRNLTGTFDANQVLMHSAMRVPAPRLPLADIEDAEIPLRHEWQRIVMLCVGKTPARIPNERELIKTHSWDLAGQPRFATHVDLSQIIRLIFRAAYDWLAPAFVLLALSCP